MKLAFVCLLVFLITYLVAKQIGIIPTVLFSLAGFAFWYIRSKRF